MDLVIDAPFDRGSWRRIILTHLRSGAEGASPARRRTEQGGMAQKETRCSRTDRCQRPHRSPVAAIPLPDVEA